MVGMAGSGASTGIAVAAYELNVSLLWLSGYACRAIKITPLTYDMK